MSSFLTVVGERRHVIEVMRAYLKLLVVILTDMVYILSSSITNPQNQNDLAYGATAWEAMLPQVRERYEFGILIQMYIVIQYRCLLLWNVVTLLLYICYFFAFCAVCLCGSIPPVACPFRLVKFHGYQVNFLYLPNTFVTYAFLLLYIA